MSLAYGIAKAITGIQILASVDIILIQTHQYTIPVCWVTDTRNYIVVGLKKGAAYFRLKTRECETPRQLVFY